MKRIALIIAAGFYLYAAPGFALSDETTERLGKTVTAVTALGRNLALHPDKHQELSSAWDVLYQKTQEIAAEIAKNKTSDPADEEALTQAHECLLALVQSREYHLRKVEGVRG